MRKFLYIAVCQLVGAAGGWATRKNLKDWYPALKKPWFNPPSWLFGPVWIALYVLMGLAGARVGHDPWCFFLFAAQLSLNGLWSFLFFAWRRLSLALLDITLLWICIAACVHFFATVDPVAA